MKKNAENQKFNVKVYDDYNARSAWMKFTCTKDTFLKKINEEFSDITQEDVDAMLEGAVNCGRLDFSDWGDVGYSDWWIDISTSKAK